MILFAQLLYKYMVINERSFLSIKKWRNTTNFLIQRYLVPNLLFYVLKQLFESKINRPFLDDFTFNGIYLCLEVKIAIDNEIFLLVEQLKLRLFFSLLHLYQNHINHCRNLTPISDPTSIFTALCCFSRISMTLRSISLGCL